MNRRVPSCGTPVEMLDGFANLQTVVHHLKVVVKRRMVLLPF